MKSRIEIFLAVLASIFVPLILFLWMLNENYSLLEIKIVISGILIVLFFISLIAFAVNEFTFVYLMNKVLNKISKLDSGDYYGVDGPPYPNNYLGKMLQILDNMSISIREKQHEIYAQAEILAKQENYDSLTNLPNRHLMYDRFNQAILRSQEEGKLLGILSLNLDRFKLMNDKFGYEAGDNIIKIIADRLTSCVHVDDTIIRLGGDEFLILINNIEKPCDIILITDKIFKSINSPLEDYQNTVINCSIGISMYPTDSENINELIQDADSAKYRAKQRGGNKVHFFTVKMIDQIKNYIRIESGLQRAINQNEFKVYYQPILDIKTNKIRSAEALLRWDCSNGEVLLPSKFINIAEETGFIIPIGEWVLTQAIKQVKHWKDLNLGIIPVAVNLSSRQFNDSKLEEFILNLLKINECPGYLLELEITESSIITNTTHTIETINRLRAMGIKISIDDFGTGYSSLNQLKHLPIDQLKIDKSFVDDIKEDDFFIDTIITLAKNLNIYTIAEGVETQKQLDFLKSKDCDSFQGYKFSKPVTAEEFEQMLIRYNKDKK